MNKIFTLTVVTAVALACVPAAFGQIDEEYTYEGPNCGDWSLAANWDPPGGPPGDDDKATILAGDNVVVDTALGSGGDHVGQLVIQAGQFSTGRVSISKDGLLTIHDVATSTNDGLILFERKGDELGELRVDGTVTMNGSGRIQGATASYVETGVCFTLDRGAVTGTTNSTLTIGTDMTMAGSLDIEVKLINNGHVGVDDLFNQGSHTMNLTEEDKSGTGEWFAERGLLVVDADITGSGAWRLDQIASTPATIRIDGAINVSGDLTFLRGTFDVDDSFCTTGTLEFGKVGGNPIIDVASGERFKAHQSSCP